MALELSREPSADILYEITVQLNLILNKKYNVE